MQELINNLQELQAKVKKTIELLDLEGKKTQIKILEKQMNEPEFWDHQEEATKVSKEVSEL